MKKILSFTIAGAFALAGLLAFVFHTVGQCCCSGLVG